MNSWVKYLLWLVGMFILLFVDYRVELLARQTAMTTFHITAQAWTMTLGLFILGVYLSLLFIKGSSRVNVPLLVCVFVPSTILGFYVPLGVTSGVLPVPLWMVQYDIHGFASLVSGFSLMVALLGNKKECQK